MVKTYSGGMRRRLDLAVSLLARPQVVFLDEPTTGLDPRSRNDLWDVIRDVVATGTTVLLTTQYLEEADQLADRIAVIDHGRMIADGTAPRAQAGGRVGARRAAPHGRRATSASPTDGSVPDVRRILADIERRGVAVDTLGGPLPHARRRLPDPHRPPTDPPTRSSPCLVDPRES